MSVKFDFNGKVAFVTGGGAGIGRETALAFARSGARVAVVGRSQKNVQATVDMINEGRGIAIAICCNVGIEEDVRAAVAMTTEAFGQLDFAFNNAGVEQPSTALANIESGVWQQNISVNLNGVFFSMKHQIPVMLRQGGGAIVNTSSGAGVKGFPGQAAYCAAKFGVIGLTKAAALDYAMSNIRINAVSPGIIETPMMARFTGGTDEGKKAAIAQEPIGRVGRPEEIAATVLWLCSESSAFTTGASIVVDGGQTV
jgi:NAD(P)-dependent dehydrogenase (short-subunit alcohol dehydrogenase family)